MTNTGTADNMRRENMKAVIKNGILYIEIPVQATPTPSSSGKTLVVASSHGNSPTGIQVAGSVLRVGVNAFIDNPAKPASASK